VTESGGEKKRKKKHKKNKEDGESAETPAQETTEKKVNFG